MNKRTHLFLISPNSPKLKSTLPNSKKSNCIFREYEINVNSHEMERAHKANKNESPISNDLR